MRSLRASIPPVRSSPLRAHPPLRRSPQERRPRPWPGPGPTGPAAVPGRYAAGDIKESHILDFSIRYGARTAGAWGRAWLPCRPRSPQDGQRGRGSVRLPPRGALGCLEAVRMRPDPGQAVVHRGPAGGRPDGARPTRGVAVATWWSHAPGAHLAGPGAQTRGLFARPNPSPDDAGRSEKRKTRTHVRNCVFHSRCGILSKHVIRCTLTAQPFAAG